jgi:hypothetical protein
VPRFGPVYQIDEACLAQLRDAIPGKVGNPLFGTPEMAKIAEKARKSRRRAT